MDIVVSVLSEHFVGVKKTQFLISFFYKDSILSSVIKRRSGMNVFRYIEDIFFKNYHFLWIYSLLKQGDTV